MIRIIYHSVSGLREDSVTLLFDLMNLLDQCMTYSRRHGITGVLAYRNSAFLQVIEGPGPAVDQLFAAILRDRRHGNIRLLARRGCDERLFGDWSMAYLGYEHDLRAHFAAARDDTTPPRAERIAGSLAELLV